MAEAEDEAGAAAAPPPAPSLIVGEEGLTADPGVSLTVDAEGETDPDPSLIVGEEGVGAADAAPPPC